MSSYKHPRGRSAAVLFFYVPRKLLMNVVEDAVGKNTVAILNLGFFVISVQRQLFQNNGLAPCLRRC